MRIHFYKMHIGGNACILLDTNQNDFPPLAQYPRMAVKLCSRRYGPGGSGCLFISPDSTLRVFDSSGHEQKAGSDALFCAARYAFDSGRVQKNKAGNSAAVFHTLDGTVTADVISSREFRIQLGSPFSMTDGHIITPENSRCIETFHIDDKPVSIAGIHIGADIAVTVPHESFPFSFFELYTKLRRSVHRSDLYLVFVRAITADTLSIRTVKRGLSTSTASAAAALIASHISGASEKDAVCIFEHGSPSPLSQQAKLAEDTDNSRKITVLWDTEINELRAVGTGGYLFEGFFEL